MSEMRPSSLQSTDVLFMAVQLGLVLQVRLSHPAKLVLLSMAVAAPSTNLVETIPQSMGKSASNGQCEAKRFKSWQWSLLTPRGELPVKHAVCAHVGCCRCRCGASVLAAVSAHAWAASATESAQQRSSGPFCGCIDVVACVNSQSVFPCCVALGVVAVLSSLSQQLHCVQYSQTLRPHSVHGGVSAVFGHE